MMKKSLWLSLGLASTIILVTSTLIPTSNTTASQTALTEEQPSEEDLSALKEERLAHLHELMKDSLENNL